MIDIVVRPRPRRAKLRAPTGPMRLHIISFRFASEGPLRRMTTVLVQGRMNQCAAMKQAAAEAGTRGPEPWLTDINTVPPLRATPALDAICRRHTAFSTFLALLTQPAGYRPSIRLDLMGQDGAVLARAYDLMQAKWGDPRGRSSAATCLGSSNLRTGWAMLPHDHVPAPACFFCAAPERVELFEVWTDHTFMLETCCDGLYETLIHEMNDDPVWARELLQKLDIENLTGQRLRRLADDDCCGMVLDWQLQHRPVSFRAARSFVGRHHAHCNPPVTWRFGQSVFNGHTMLGVLYGVEQSSRNIRAGQSSRHESATDSR